MFRTNRLAYTILIPLAGALMACATAGTEPTPDSGGAPPDAPEFRLPDARIVFDATPPPDGPPGTPDATPPPPDATPPPPDAACIPTVMELLSNGNFEQGTAGWVEVAAMYPIILSTNDPQYPLPVTPESGSYAAWLGGVDSSVRAIYQNIFVPAGATNLTVRAYHYIASEDSTTVVYDTATATLRNTNNGVLEQLGSWSNLTTDANWTLFNRIPAGNYGGQTIRLHVESNNDISLNTNFFFDSISVQATVTVCQ